MLAFVQVLIQQFWHWRCGHGACLRFWQQVSRLAYAAPVVRGYSEKKYRRLLLALQGIHHLPGCNYRWHIWAPPPSVVGPYSPTVGRVIYGCSWNNSWTWQGVPNLIRACVCERGVLLACMGACRSTSARTYIRHTMCIYNILILRLCFFLDM